MVLFARICKYQQEGILFPYPALNQDEVNEVQQEYLNLCKQGKMILEGEQRVFCHLLYPWVTKLVHHPAILEKVRQLIGPNILVWVSEFNAKAPNSLHYFSWHQDLYYWNYQYDPGVTNIPIVTVWLALFKANLSNGCMQVIPGSHTHLMSHQENIQENNMLTRGQEIQVSVDEKKAVPVELAAGEFSIHHPLIHHASGPNLSSLPRVGLVIRYLAPEIVPPAYPAYGWLVSGEDESNHWSHVAPLDLKVGDEGYKLQKKCISSVQSFTGAQFR